MHPHERNRIAQSVLLVASVVVVLHALGWLQPGAGPELDTKILYPVIALVSLWGLLRRLRRQS